MDTSSTNRLPAFTALFLSTFWIIGCISTEDTTAASYPDNQPAQEEDDYLQPSDPLPNSGLSDNIIHADIDQIFKRYNYNNTPGCAVAVYQNGNTVFSKGYGLANLDYGIPISDSTSFNMASISKQVTAAAAGLLVLRGQLDLDSEVADYLEDWPVWAYGVTIRHLINHTSGLPDVYDVMKIAGISINDVMTIDGYLNIIKKGESLMFQPGTKYSYTNSGYTILAFLVQKISGEKFSKFAHQQFFKPFGMSSTHFHDDRQRVIQNRAMSYERSYPGYNQIYPGNFQGVGDGGLYSTLKDWERWDSFWNGTLEWKGGLTKMEAMELKKLMTTQLVIGNKTSNHGMAMNFAIRKGMQEVRIGGSFMGFNSEYRRYPDQGISFLTLCNRGDANPQYFNSKLADHLLKEPMEIYLEPFEGIYHSDELSAQLTLTIEDGELRVIRRLTPNGWMVENGGDNWNAGSWEMAFQRDKNGRVEGLKVSTGRARNVEFKRISR
ncbi:MAG: serine hydrolase [Balneolales bacterium]